jgi:hypothetical protein
MLLIITLRAGAEKLLIRLAAFVVLLGLAFAGVLMVVSSSRQNAATPAPSASSEALDARLADCSASASLVLYCYAGLVSEGQAQRAASLLELPLRSVLSMNDYAPIRNTPRMEILRLEPRDGVWGQSLEREAPRPPNGTCSIWKLVIRYSGLSTATSRTIRCISTKRPLQGFLPKAGASPSCRAERVASPDLVAGAA